MLRAPRVILIVLLACAAVAACGAPQPLTPTSTPLPVPFPTTTPTPRPTPTLPPTVSAPPKIISHPKPALRVDLQVLRRAGCAIDWGRYGGAWVCPDNAAIQALGCDTLAPDNLLAGFRPLLPVMRCHSFRTEPPDSEHFRCVEGSYNSYLLIQDGQYRLIANQSELQALFAPVESADEAMSFALVATDLAAKFGLEKTGDQYFAKTLEGTHVVETREGYVVNLFTAPTPRCDCATHVTSAADVLVTHEGRVEVLKTQPAYGYSACRDCWFAEFCR